MPQAVGIIGAIVGGVMVEKGLVVYGLIVSLASNIIASAWQRHDAKKDTEDETAAGARANTRTSQARLGICYGKARVGGNDVFIDTRDWENYNLWIVQALCEGECEGVDYVYLGNKELAPNSEFGVYANYYFHGGSSDQAVDSHLSAKVPEWTDRLPYTCYIVYQMHYNENYFSGVPERSVVLKGIKCYDFRTGITQWTDNPVLHLYDYMTNTRYGLGISRQLFDQDTWTTCADYVDDREWRYNKMISGDVHAQDVIDDLLKHFRGVMLEYDGMIYLHYTDMDANFANGKYAQTVAMSLTDNDIAVGADGKVNLSVEKPSVFNRPTSARIKYVRIGTGEKNEYIYDNVIIGNDGGGEIEEIQLEGCTNRKMAGELGTYFLERAQENMLITGVFRDSAMQLDPHDIVRLTTTSLGFEDEDLRIISINNQSNGLVQLQLIRDYVSLYNKDYDAKDFQPFNCTLPDRNAQTHVNASAPTEEIYYYRERRFTRLYIDLTLPTNTPFFDYAQVWVSLNGGDDYDHLFNVTNSFYIDPIEEGKEYYIKIVAVTKFGVVEDWDNAELVTHNVLGYTSYPSSLTYLNATVNQNSISLYSTKVNDADIELYEFRLGSSWPAGIFLGALRSPNYTLVGVKPGTHTFIANTYSNNGIYGQVPRSTTATLIDPPDGWEHSTEQSWMDNADDFTDSTAEFYNMELHSGGGYDGYLKCSHQQMTYEYLDFLDDLLCIFPCNENSGSTIESYNSSYQFDINSPADWNTGGYSDDCIYMPDDGSLSYDEATGDEFDCDNFTFCAWLKYVVDYNWDDGDQKGIAYRAGKYKIYSKLEGDKSSPDYKVYAEITAGGETTTLTSSESFDGSKYTHIAVTYDGTNIKLYINGDLDTTVEHDAGGNMDGDPAGTTYFGYDGTNSHYGYIDEIVFDDSALPYEQIKDIADMTAFQGIYKSPIFEIPTSARHLIYVEGDIYVSGTGTTWKSVFNSTMTGRQGGLTTQSWLEIFEVTDGAKVNIKAYCSDSYDSTWPAGASEVPMMEILTGIVTAKYYQIEIKIADANDSVHAYLEPYVLHICDEV